MLKNSRFKNKKIDTINQVIKKRMLYKMTDKEIVEKLFNKWLIETKPIDIYKSVRKIIAKGIQQGRELEREKHPNGMKNCSCVDTSQKLAFRQGIQQGRELQKQEDLLEMGKITKRPIRN